VTGRPIFAPGRKKKWPAKKEEKWQNAYKRRLPTVAPSCMGPETEGPPAAAPGPLGMGKGRVRIELQRPLERRLRSIPIRELRRGRRARGHPPPPRHPAPNPPPKKTHTQHTPQRPSSSVVTSAGGVSESESLAAGVSAFLPPPRSHAVPRDRGESGGGTERGEGGGKRGGGRAARRRGPKGCGGTPALATPGDNTGPQHGTKRGGNTGPRTLARGETRAPPPPHDRGARATRGERGKRIRDPE